MNEQQVMSRSQKKIIMPRWLQRHAEALMDCLERMVFQPFSSAMVVCLIGVALALPASMWLGGTNLKAMSQGWEDGSQISLYLSRNLTTSELNRFIKQVRLYPGVGAVKYVSPESGMKALEASFGVSQVLEQLPENPLPPVLEVYPSVGQRNTDAIEALYQGLQQMPPVDAAQLDLQWVQRLFALMSLLGRLGLAVMAMFCVAVVLVIGNSVRTATQMRQQEIIVMQLIGATAAMVRRPFLYTGACYGFLGGLLALGIVCLMTLLLSQPVAHLMELYQSDFRLMGFSLGQAMGLVGLSSVLGWLGAHLALRRYLV